LSVDYTVYQDEKDMNATLRPLVRTPAVGISALCIAATVVTMLLVAGCGEKVTTPSTDGLLFISSLPGRALIHVDAISTTKTTPDTLYVEPGDHTLTLTLSGYRDSTVEFTVSESDTLSFGIDLEPLEGTLRWVQVPGVDATIFDVDFASVNYGYAVGENGRTFRTYEGGVTWNEVTTETSENLLSVRFVSSSNGWACGTNGVILRTTDLGVSWDTVPSGTSFDLHDIFFVDVNNGWAVGESGTVLRSTDGGLTWTPQNSETSLNLSAVHFFSTTLGWAVGGFIRGEGQVILRTTNGGATWSERPSVSDSCLRDVVFLTSTLGLCAGDDGLIVRSTDGGLTWGPVGQAAPVSLRSLASWSNVDWWVVGGEYGGSGYVLRSSDGGLTWYPFEETPQAVLCVDAIEGANSGWAGGEGGLWGYR
jgi:photosystem II stability/assembly factor-like uncharacterized protein